MADNAVSYNPARARSTLFAALLEARDKYGPGRAILVDGDELKLTYQDLTRGALALGHALKKNTRKGEAVGVLLPTGIGSVISVFALSAYGRVPAMLNFTAGAHSLHAALRLAQVSRVVTAHRFIELGKFEALESELKSVAQMIYLEDIRERLSAFDKGAAVIGSFLPRIISRRAPKASPRAWCFRTPIFFPMSSRCARISISMKPTSCSIRSPPSILSV